MCSIDAHDRYHPTINDDASSGGGITLPYNSTKYVSVSFGLTLNFIDIWLKLLKTNYLHQTRMYCEEMCEFFENIPVAITEPKTYDYIKKIQPLLTDILR